MCMRYVLAVVLVVLFFGSFVSAQSTTINWDDLRCETLTYQGKPLKEASVPLPKDLANFLDEEKINFVIESKGTAYGEVRNGMISNISCTPSQSPSLYVVASKASIQKIVDSAYPLKTLKELIASKEIEFQPVSGFTYLKFFFLSLVFVFV